MRSRRLFLLGMALILLFVLVPNLWGRAERLLYPRKYEVLVDQWAETYGLDPLLVDAFIRTESGFDPQATSTVDARGLMQMTEDLLGNQLGKIVKLVEVIPTHPASLNEDYLRLEEMALQDKQERVFREWLTKKIDGMYVYISPEFRNGEFENKHWVK